MPEVRSQGWEKFLVTGVVRPDRNAGQIQFKEEHENLACFTVFSVLPV